MAYTNLENDEISRYSRQLILPEIGVKGLYHVFIHLLLARELYRTAEGKECLSTHCWLWRPRLSHCTISGGSWSRWVCITRDVITRSRVGHIGLVDYDVVELSNLHRQVI